MLAVHFFHRDRANELALDFLVEMSHGCGIIVFVVGRIDCQIELLCIFKRANV